MKEKTLTELKAEAYDAIALVEEWQRRLANINDMIRHRIEQEQKAMLASVNEDLNQAK